MTSGSTTDALPAAYERLHTYGPEFGGDEEGNHGLTNHGPMAIEVMVRRVERVAGPGTTRLESLADLAAKAYLAFGHGSPFLLVHAAAAPNAVRHVLPVLPSGQWLPSLTAAWAAVVAVVATYAPARPAPYAEIVRRCPQPTRDDALQQAAEHGDEHVLKFADTAVESHDRTGDPELHTATLHAGRLIDRP